MTDWIREFVDVVESATGRLLELDDGAAAERPKPGAWSPKEVVGHLVDSASVNHERFVRAQFQDELVFAGYAQDEWVARQGYAGTDWRTLVELWRALNLHVARVMEAAPEAERSRERRRHNLHQIAWQTVPEQQPTTLDYLMRDYVDHLKHHLAEVL